MCDIEKFQTFIVSATMAIFKESTSYRSKKNYVKNDHEATSPFESLIQHVCWKKHPLTVINLSKEDNKYEQTQVKTDSNKPIQLKLPKGLDMYVIRCLENDRVSYVI